jgi:AraC family transcriptional regulator of arabinose operon
MRIFQEILPCFCGIITYKQGSRLGPRIQGDLQLVYIHSGSVDIRINGNHHHLKAGEATLLLPGAEELFTFSASERTRHGWCGIYRPVLSDRDLRKLKALPFSRPFSDRMKAIEALFLPLQASSLRAAGPRQSLLVQAMLAEYLESAEGIPGPEQPEHPAVTSARTYMEAHLREPVRLADLAREAGITPPHLIRLFREHLNTTPKAYLWHLRVEAAAKLMRSTGLSSAEVAYASGFSNPQHFSRLFRKHTGLPPRAWRLSQWSQSPEDSYRTK